MMWIFGWRSASSRNVSCNPSCGSTHVMLASGKISRQILVQSPRKAPTSIILLGTKPNLLNCLSDQRISGTPRWTASRLRKSDGILFNKNPSKILANIRKSISYPILPLCFLRRKENTGSYSEGWAELLHHRRAINLSVSVSRANTVHLPATPLHII